MLHTYTMTMIAMLSLPGYQIIAAVMLLAALLMVAVVVTLHQLKQRALYREAMRAQMEREAVDLKAIEEYRWRGDDDGLSKA